MSKSRTVKFKHCERHDARCSVYMSTAKHGRIEANAKRWGMPFWFASELAENLWRQRQRDRLGITALERTVYELEDRLNDIERDRVKRGGRR